MKFKKGEIITCIKDDNSGNKLTNNKTYITESDSFIFQHIEYVKVKNIKASMFYVNRFVNAQKLRKEKLKKIHENNY